MDEFQAFASFVKRHATGIIAAAYIPTLTQTFFPFPRGTVASQVPAAGAGVLTILVVVCAFWLRTGIAKRPGVWLPIGLALVVAGMGALLEYASACNRFMEAAPPGVPHEMYSLNSQQTLTALLWYLPSFPILVTGVTIVFLYGFVRTEEPVYTLQAMAGELSEQLRTFLGRTAISMRAVETGILSEGRRLAERARESFKQGAVALLKDTVDVLDRITEGTLEIRGPAMDDVYAACVRAIRDGGRFRATSLNDLDYWANPDEAAQYLEQNRLLIARRCSVERIFIIDRNLRISGAGRRAIENQIEMGIVVRIAYLERCRNIEAPHGLDFGLLDDFAVSFWRKDRGRVFRLMAEAGTCEKYGEIYDHITAMCEVLTDGPGVERTQLTRNTLGTWLARHPGGGDTA